MKLFAIILAATIAAPALADTSSGSTSTSDATNQGNSQSVTFTSPGESTTHVYTGTQTIKNTPSVNGPPLVSSNDTCMGSFSGSGNVPGFGISVGKTYTDTNCVRLKNSRELWNMGMHEAALALQCKDAETRDALEATGFPCSKYDRQHTAQAPVEDHSTHGPLPEVSSIK
jgi:hypothetical protein